MRSSTSPLRLLALAALAAIQVAACSVAPAAKAPEEAPASAAPAADEQLAEEREEEALDTVDDASLAFEQAERTLLASFEPGAGAEAAPVQPGAETAEHPLGQPAQPPVATARNVDRCEHACRALGSMRRAADRLCELTGSEDPRCEGVGERVAQARERVRGSCPACQHLAP